MSKQTPPPLSDVLIHPGDICPLLILRVLKQQQCLVMILAIVCYPGNAAGIRSAVISGGSMAVCMQDSAQPPDEIFILVCFVRQVMLIVSFNPVPLMQEKLSRRAVDAASGKAKDVGQQKNQQHSLEQMLFHIPSLVNSQR